MPLLIPDDAWVRTLQQWLQSKLSIRPLALFYPKKAPSMVQGGGAYICGFLVCCRVLFSPHERGFKGKGSAEGPFPYNSLETE